MRIVMVLGVLVGFACCGGAAEGARTTVYATMFPAYDFARIVGGDRVAAHLLISPGADSHSYEPTPSDMAKIARADLFIHAGEAMEPWAARIAAAAADGGNVRAVDAARGIGLLPIGIANDEHEHADEDHDDGDMAVGDESGHDHDHGHGHAFDPHYWLDPLLAVTMVDTIEEALAAASPADAEFFRANGDRLRDELRGLDAEAREAVRDGKRRVLVFGGRFAFAYFFHRYGLEEVGVYDSCGPGAEPSLRRVAEVAAFIREHRIPVIYHEEMAEPRVARVLAQETGAELMMTHSIHNLTADEMARGLGYLDLMRQTLAAFRRGME